MVLTPFAPSSHPHSVLTSLVFSLLRSLSEGGVDVCPCWLETGGAATTAFHFAGACTPNCSLLTEEGAAAAGQTPCTGNDQSAVTRGTWAATTYKEPQIQKECLTFQEHNALCC